MKNIKKNWKRWKQIMTILIIAVMIFTTPHIVGFASMGNEEVQTESGNKSETEAQKKEAATENKESSTDKKEESQATEKKTETTEKEEKSTEAATEEKTEETQEKTETKNSNVKNDSDSKDTTSGVVTKKYRSSEVNVTVTATDGKTFPDEAELVVKKINLNENTEQKLEEAAVLEEKRTVKKMYAYDIHFEVDGKEIQPSSSVEVAVDIRGISAGQNAAVFHVDDKNKVENMNGDVDGKGDVVFETTHFSTYVIIQQGSNKVKATIKHYDNDSTEDSNGEKTKIYADDSMEIPVGGRINDYAKANNWDVDHVVVKSKNTDGTENRQNYTSEAGYSEISLSRDATVEVYYTAKSAEVKGQTKLYDYTIMAGQGDGTYWNDKGSIYYSINMPSNPSYGKISDSASRLTMGESGSGNNGWNISAGNYGVYQNYNCKVDVNENGKKKTYNANAWTGTGYGAVTGLLKGIDANGKVIFNYPEPGFFDESDLSVTLNGTTRYLRKVFTDYKLVFTQTGDSYQLKQVNKPGTNGSDETKVTSAGKDFFPLDSIDEKYKNEKSTANKKQGDHNYYFGMRYDVDFKLGDYIGPLNYEFTGDDDLWVVLDGNKIVLDLGGIHDALTGKVNLWDYLLNDGQTKEELTDAQKEQEHTLTVLYMERGAGVSNCNMKFTLPSARITQVTEAESTSLMLHKINKKNEALKGARFTLTSSKGEKQTSTSDENGNASFTKLTEGTYTLTEDAAPTDYIPSVDNWIVKVEKNEQGTLVAKMYLSDGKTLYTKKEGDYYDVLNLTEQELVDSVMDYSKTAHVTDWDKRTYNIDITASSKLTKSTTIMNNEVSDTMLVLDVSGSMLKESSTQSKDTEPSTYYDKCTKSTLNNLDTTKIYYYGNTTKSVQYSVGRQTYSYENLAHPMIYVHSSWKYYDGNSWRDVPESSNTGIYTSTSRLNGLKEAAIGFVSSMAQASSESKLGITTFNSDKNRIVEMESIGNNVEDILKKIATITASGGTKPDTGLSDAEGQLEPLLSDGRSKNVILFTDGKPTGTGSSWSDTAAKEAESEADKIKEKGIKIYTVGFVLDDQTKTWLAGGTYNNTTYKGIASKDCALNADDVSGLKTIFKELQQTMTQSLAIKPAQIQDVIDPRFVILDDNNKPITEEYTVTIDGKTYDTTETGIPLANGGTVYYGEFDQKDADGNVIKDSDGNAVKKKYQYIIWNEQTIPSKSDGEWKKTISVVAKEEYIGGNDIPTNISPDSKVSTSYGDAVLPQPKVNVKADLLVNNYEEKVFYGEKGSYSEDILKTLFDTANPQGEITTVEGKNKKVTYTIGADGEQITSKDFTLTWYKDEACTEEITPGTEYMEDEIPGPDSKSYYLKVTYNKMQNPTDESNTNTTLNGDIKKNEVPLKAHNSEESKDRKYGVYKITVVPGQLEINKTLLSNSGYIESHSATFKFTVMKIKDENGEKLEQPEKIGDFTVSFDKDDQSLTKAVTDDKNILNNLKKGVYQVSETLPESDSYYQFKSAEVASETKCDNHAEDDQNTLTFAIGYKDLDTPGSKNFDKNIGKAIYTNERLASVTIKKIGEKDSDNKDKPLKGAKFKIEKITGTGGNESYKSPKEDGTDYIIETGDDGTASFEKLKEGRYRITEIQSPKGYSLLANPIEVSLPYTASSDTAGIETSENEAVKVDNTNYYYDITYTIKNNKLFDMPEAGGGFRATIIGVVIMLIAGGWYIIRKRRRTA